MSEKPRWPNGNPYLRRDGTNAGEPQCERCRGAGWAHASFRMLPPKVMAETMKFKTFADMPVQMEKTVCGACNGSGLIYPDPQKSGQS